MTIWSHRLISYKDLKTLVRINFPNWKHTVLNVDVLTSKNILSCIWIWRCGVGWGISGSEFLCRLTMKNFLFLVLPYTLAFLRFARQTVLLLGFPSCRHFYSFQILIFLFCFCLFSFSLCLWVPSIFNFSEYHFSKVWHI